MCVSDILWDFQGGKSFISLSKWTRTGSRVANLSNSTIFQVCEISQLNRKINRRRETLLLLNKHRWWQWRWYYNCFRNDDFPSNQTDDDDTSANGLPHIGRWLEWWGDLPMRMCLLTTRWDCSCPSNNKYLWSAHHKIISNATKCLGSSQGREFLEFYQWYLVHWCCGAFVTDVQTWFLGFGSIKRYLWSSLNVCRTNITIMII